MKIESMCPFSVSRLTRAVLAVVMSAIVTAGASACASSEPPEDLGGAPSVSTPTPLPTGEVSPSEDDLVVTFAADADGPHAVAGYRGQTRQAFVASHCWTFEPSGEPPVTPVMCVDTVGPSAETLPPMLEVPSGTELVIEGTATVVDGSIARLPRPFHPIATLDLTDGTAVLVQQPGEYVLSFFATWPQGDVPFFVGVAITG
jgi:hypothetical protein